NGAEGIVRQIMNLYERPEAIFSAGDRLSIECMKVLQRLDIKIPEDMDFVGFTNITEVNMFKSPITAVSQPAFEIGQLAAEMLIKRIESKLYFADTETRVLATKLNICNS